MQLDKDVVVVEAENFQGTIEQLALEAPVDLLLLDLSMPGTDKLVGFFAIRRQHPDLSVVVVSGSDDLQLMREILDGGARGYIPKLITNEELTYALQTVVSGEVYVPNMLFEPRNGE